MATNGSVVQVPAVQFPGNPCDPAETDIARPTYDLLRTLNLLGSPDDYKSDDNLKSLVSTPAPSITVIESGATAMAKLWTFLLGTGVTLAGVGAAAQGIWGNEHDIVRVAIIGGAAVVVASVSIAIAMIISNDVRSRALAATATIQARAAISIEFMSLSQNCGPAPANAQPAHPAARFTR